MAPSPSGKAKVCNTFITSSNLVGAFSEASGIDISEVFYDIGNFVPYIIKTLRGMRTRAKRKFVASDRARRENVPGHILFI